MDDSKSAKNSQRGFVEHETVYKMTYKLSCAREDKLSYSHFSKIPEILMRF
jgi:hypothetical protein